MASYLSGPVLHLIPRPPNKGPSAHVQAPAAAPTVIVASPEQLEIIVERAVARALARPRPEKRLVTVSEAARFLSVDPRTVRRRVKRGELPAFGAGRAMRIDLSAYDLTETDLAQEAHMAMHSGSR